MSEDNIAKVDISIQVPKSKVWNALTDPEIIKKYMFGTNVVSDWQEGSPIVWKGEWKGQEYEDKGEIIKIEKEKVLQYTHYSALSGVPDEEENYHTVTVDLDDTDGVTQVTLTQTNNSTPEEKEHSEKNWQMMLESMKELLEK